MPDMSLEVFALPLALALSALVLGFIVALIYVRKSKRQKQNEPQNIDLDERVSHVINQLNDLDEQSERIDPTSYQHERNRLNTLSNQLLTERDQLALQQEASAKSEESSSKNTPKSSWRGFVWGSGITMVIFGLILSIQQTEKPRPDTRPPVQTSQLPQNHPPIAGQNAPQGEILELVNALKKNPKDISSMLRLSSVLLKMQMFREASLVTSRILEIDPKNVNAKVYQAVIKAGTDKNPKAAIEDLTKIVTKHPNASKGWFFIGMLNMQMGNNAGMTTSFKRYLETAPPGPQKERIQKMMATQLAQ